MLGKLFGNTRSAQEAFVDLMLRSARQMQPGATVRYDEQHFCIELYMDPESAEPARLSLHNVFREAQQHRRRDWPAIAEHYLHSLFDAANEPQNRSFETVRDHLMVRVRGRELLNELRLHRLEQGARDDTISFAHARTDTLPDHLMVEFVEDLPNSIRSLTAEEVQAWGVPEGELLEIARHNIRRAGDGMSGFEEVQDRIYLSTWGDSYDSSRLLTPELIQRLPVKGRHVVFPLSRDTVGLVGDEDEEGLQLMAGNFLNNLDSVRLDSIIHPLVLTDHGRWERFELPDNHPASAFVAQLRTLTLGEAYKHQEAYLEKYLELTGDDIYVAPFTGLKDKETGMVRTYCTWNEGVDSLLPEADLVAFVVGHFQNREEDLWFVPFARVHQVVGDLMELTDEFPVRYRVREFPAGERLEELRRHAI